MGTDFAYEDLRPENPGVHRYTQVGSEASTDATAW